MKELDLTNYEITLLTIEEYNNFREKIPCVRYWWWLRSPGINSGFAAYVNRDGSINNVGYFVNYFNYAVRPALKSESINFPVGSKFISLGNRWIAIGEHIAISESVIGFRSFDSLSNDWESSELRQWLESWEKEAERKTGRWININDGKWNTIPAYKCSVCGEIDNRVYKTDSYCPHCGCKMELEHDT